MLSYLLLSSLALADDTDLYMGDMAVTAVLPKGWNVPRWSDWDLDAVDSGKTVQIKVYDSNWQVELDADAARSFAQLAVGQLEDEGHDSVEIVSTDLGTVDGLKVATAELSYRFKGDSKAVLYQRSFSVAGRTVHLYATSVLRNGARARKALDVWQPALEIGKPAQDITALPRTLVLDGHFELDIPAGWRAPLEAETSLARALAAESFKQELGPEGCQVAVRPYDDGSAGVLLACGYTLYTNKTDTFSQRGLSEEVREHFFKASAGQVGILEPSIADDGRYTFVYALPDSANSINRMAATPYDRGHALLYLQGSKDELSELEGTLRAAATSTGFSGPDGAQHPVGVYQYAMYLWTWRRSSPLVIGPLVLVGLALIGAVLALRGRKPSYE